MNTITSPPPQSTATEGNVDAQRLIELLDALQPSKQQRKVLLFQKAYPAIERAIGREVPQKQIVAELENSGLSLSMGGFRSLLEAERKQRKESGDRVRCEHCGSNLPHVGDEGSPAHATT
ncbi:MULTISPECIES: hypothetical protein [Burkholderia cepacia complex]|uniref:hypothetical protein n=1 Tax=Burkholderia cepacia complex TaxID=87882 RepID=UPI000F0731B9|nr:MULTISPECIES: hypothetical protein [Burkholderia cepacia complex]AYQ43405.1 hypothetical protein CVS37_28665 [Burkholderia lata]